jgi:cytoplasmic iron level regulating protein YaaA (DUF328/UPF0246 family)
MIVLMNSSKTLDFDPAPTGSTLTPTIPEFIKDAEILVKELRRLSESELSELMGISDKLAKLNVARYANWQTGTAPANAKQALLAFQGDIYTGIETERYDTKDFAFAQQHVRILSGLYGILRPLDLIQPYRLEMATKLPTDRGKNLYSFWGNRITDSLRAMLEQEKSGVIVNLCSVEYLSAIQNDALEASVVTPVFKEFKDGSYRFVTIYAKKARGLMCNYIIQNKLDRIADLKSFDSEGYQYNKKISLDREWVFTRGESKPAA